MKYTYWLYGFILFYLKVYICSYDFHIQFFSLIDVGLGLILALRTVYSIRLCPHPWVEASALLASPPTKVLLLIYIYQTILQAFIRLYYKHWIVVRNHLTLNLLYFEDHFFLFLTSLNFCFVDCYVIGNMLYSNDHKETPSKGVIGFLHLIVLT